MNGSVALMTINDAEGLMTAQRSDGHIWWPCDLGSFAQKIN